MEGTARQAYVGQRLRALAAEGSQLEQSFSLQEVGLCIWRDEPWLAASPDGVVRERGSLGALEIKCCPDSSKMWSVENIPLAFYDQMQGTMAVLSASFGESVLWCDFFVWSPQRKLCRRVEFDGKYFHGQLMPKLRAFYFSRYVPAALRMPVGVRSSQVARSTHKAHKGGRRRQAAGPMNAG